MFFFPITFPLSVESLTKPCHLHFLKSPLSLLMSLVIKNNELIKFPWKSRTGEKDLREGVVVRYSSRAAESVGGRVKSQCVRDF